MEVDKINKKEPKAVELREFVWEAPEYERKEKAKSWFIIPAIIAIAICVFALLTDNYLFMVLVLMSFFAFYIYANKPPRTIKFKINEKGIEVDNRPFEFEHLRSFWIFYNPPLEKTLSLRSRKTFFPYLRIPLADESPTEIRKFLLNFIPEKKHQESLIDIWMKKSGF